MPLDFLLSVMRHPKTPATLRIKMALATQPYIHPRKSNRPTSPVAAAGDRHGFEVDPAMAKKLRNEIARLGKLKRRRNPRPDDQKTEQKLHQKIEAKIATLQCPCPSRYSVEDAARDKQTLARLWRRRRSRAKLAAREVLARTASLHRHAITSDAVTPVWRRLSEAPVAHRQGGSEMKERCRSNNGTIRLTTELRLARGSTPAGVHKRA